ncbi:AAA family ATPase [Nostoc ellipsosporum NOK]|nr:AAA family ATPase [Nostoc ellipsosporum NOK]
MQLKNNPIDISAENPFANCKLERQKYADVLTQIVKFYADGFVMAINNDWGTGKTTFVKMWRQQLENSGINTIYFNAWENDFDNIPIIGLISELQTLVNSRNEKIFKSLLKNGAVLVKNVAPAIIKSVAKKFIATEEIVTAIEQSSKAAAEIFEEEVKEYTKKKKSIADFRNELEKFIVSREKPEPLVFIVDELDRCRPDYAVELLEQLKHFFTVPGLIFVLSIDKKHLASSIRGFYGSEMIDADEYLRRFIDLEYSIPRPSTEAFCRYLYSYYSFESFFHLPSRRNTGLYNDGEILLKMAIVLLTYNSATLRQSEKVFSFCRLIMKSFGDSDRTHSALLFYLVYLKVFHSDLYSKVERKSVDAQGLCNLFADTIPTEYIDRSGDLNFLYIQAQFIWFYNNSKPESLQETLVKSRWGHDDSITNLTSRLDKTDAGDGLLRVFEQFNQDRFSHSLDYLLKKINLTDNIKS